VGEVRSRLISNRTRRVSKIMKSRRHGSRRLPLVLACIALAAVIVLAACGSSDDNSSSGGSTSGGGSSSGSKKNGKDVNLAIVTASSTQNAFQEMDLGGKSAGSHEGVNLKSSAPNGVNGPQEVQLFNAAVQTSKDGVGVMTTTPN